MRHLPQFYSGVAGARRTTPAILGDYAHTLPECNSTFDLRGRIPGFGVVPRGIHVSITVDVQRVIVGRALPRTHARVATGFQQRLIDRRPREIMITFHDDCIRRLRDYRTFPDCLHDDPRNLMRDFSSNPIHDTPGIRTLP